KVCSRRQCCVEICEPAAHVQSKCRVDAVKRIDDRVDDHVESVGLCRRQVEDWGQTIRDERAGRAAKADDAAGCSPIEEIQLLLWPPMLGHLRALGAL